MTPPTKSSILYFILSAAAIAIFALSFIRESSHQVQSCLGVNPSPIPKTGLTTTVPSHGDYLLPYPGILPTHPLYPLKMIKDRIGLVLTTNPHRRALLLLHYADKRMAAANLLIQNGQSGKAISTAIKAEIYLGQAISNSQKIDQTLAPAFFDQLKKAALKHEEVIEKLIETTEGGPRNQATNLHQQLDQYRHQIISLSGEPFGYPRPEDVKVPSASSSASPSEIPNVTPIEPYL